MSDSIVYIVDDNATVCRALCRLMRASGLGAMSFNSAQAFLDHRRADKPGCLILDMRMPGLNGLDLQTRSRKDDQDPPRPRHAEDAGELRGRSRPHGRAYQPAHRLGSAAIKLPTTKA